MKKVYNASGYVLGNFWGGGTGAYPSVHLHGFDSKMALKKKATKMLKDGSLDLGMGFESLKGAILNIEEVSTVIVKGEKYKRSNLFLETIGTMKSKEIDFLRDTYVNAY